MEFGQNFNLILVDPQEGRQNEEKLPSDTSRDKQESPSPPRSLLADDVEYTIAVPGRPKSRTPNISSFFCFHMNKKRTNVGKVRPNKFLFASAVPETQSLLVLTLTRSDPYEQKGHRLGDCGMHVHE